VCVSKDANGKAKSSHFIKKILLGVQVALFFNKALAPFVENGYVA
jgi:hypothetical protein